ncbi:hypothetical protein FACS1894199_00350 [Bacteroidia bacterium]|nr:hypothetical protein FACS1894199_00350 [Bacteroidia bacterium]
MELGAKKINKNMTKIFSYVVPLFMAILLFISSCRKDETEHPFFNLSKTTDIVCSPSANEQYLLLSSSHKWTVNSVAEWCEVSHANRNNQVGNDILVLFKIAENESLSSRETSITFTTDAGLTTDITVKQMGLSDKYLILSTDSVNFVPNGGEKILILSTSHDCTVESDADWLKVANPTCKKGDNLSVLLTAAGNTSFETRSAQVTIRTTLDNSVQIKVEQAGQIETLPRMLSFAFRASVNSLLLAQDITCNINESDSLISIRMPHVMESKILVPEFTFDGQQVLVNGEAQTSGQNSIDFSAPVEYVVQNASGTSRKYTVRISSFTDLPVVFINTENSASINSKDNYVNATIRVVENSVTTTNSAVKIKGRGNSTWKNMPKKPYKMKFDSKTSLLGEPKDKEWVLLANYADKTALRNETSFFMGRLSQLAWTPRTHFVEVFINEVYNGTYQLCEQIKIATDRVNVTDDGYLMEVDQLERLEPGDVYFETPRLFFYIKDPDVEYGSERYNWIKNYVSNVENLLYSENFEAETGYAQYVDISSFVDWYLINEITKNTDAAMYSSCYLHIAPNGKLKMGPLWDFDIGLGNVNYNTNNIPTGLLIARAAWFKQLLKDPVFVAQVKTRFAYFKSKKNEIFSNINENAEYLKWSVIENNNRWNTLYVETWPNYAIWGNYDNEIQYMKNWLDARLEWLEQAFAGM